jgi:hypothetical protein
VKTIFGPIFGMQLIVDDGILRCQAAEQIGSEWPWKIKAVDPKDIKFHEGLIGKVSFV